ncbi:unnamed protein product [Diatraea saccharalis]|uniref:Uncharacterized protein n=1 Tax=Diatraea saccharalis TaxID=40085 RepID=A0A9N9RE80_9NEOP|nr:unnamed protein product [Diatraea saccharalis]
MNTKQKKNFETLNIENDKTKKKQLKSSFKSKEDKENITNSENEFSSDDSGIDPNYNQDTKNISASDSDEYETISNKRKFAKNDLQSKRSKYENDVQLARKTSYQQKKVSPMIIYDIPSNEKTIPFLRNRPLSNSSSSGSSSSGSSSSGTSSSVSTSSGSSRSWSPNTRPLADNQTTDTQISDKPLVPSLSYLCRKIVSASKTSSGSKTKTNSYKLIDETSLAQSLNQEISDEEDTSGEDCSDVEPDITDDLVQIEECESESEIEGDYDLNGLPEPTASSKFQSPSMRMIIFRFRAYSLYL